MPLSVQHWSTSTTVDCTQLSDKGVLYSAGKWSSRLVRSLSTTRWIREPSISTLLSTQQPHAVVGPQAHELVIEFIFTSFEPPGISSELKLDHPPTPPSYPPPTVSPSQVHGEREGRVNKQQKSTGKKCIVIYIYIYNITNNF